MDKDLKKDLKSFLDNDKVAPKSEEVVIINNNTNGLVERVEKTFVTNDGRQLLAD